MKKKGGKLSESQGSLNKSQRSDLITMEKLQGKESLSFQGKVMSSSKSSVWLCVWESLEKREAHVIIGPGPDRGQAGRPADGARERDVYLELQSSRLWGGVRYCSRAWQGQEGTREGACPRGRGALPPRRCGLVGGMEGRYWQIFVGCRCSICRCLIELCDDELVAPLICIRTIPGGGSGVSGVPRTKWAAGCRRPSRTCELEVDFIQWQGYWLILISVCLSGSASDICPSQDNVVSQSMKWKKHSLLFLVWFAAHS